MAENYIYPNILNFISKNIACQITIFQILIDESYKINQITLKYFLTFINKIKDSKFNFYKF